MSGSARRLLSATLLTAVAAVGGVGAVPGTAVAAPDPIDAKYSALGGPGSFLAAPTSAEYAVPGGRARDYQGGSVYWSPGTGAWSVRGLIRDEFRTVGGPGGVLGFPTTDETPTPDAVGRFVQFSGTGGASIYWTPNTGAHEVHGALRAHWAALGWETGVLGYPVTDEIAAPDGVGRFNHFAASGGASLYWTPATGAHDVYGAIRDRWSSLGWERSMFGYPTADEYAIAGGRRADFVNGAISWRASDGATTDLRNPNPVPPPVPPLGPRPSTWQVNPADTRKVATEIGAGSLNPAPGNGIYGADLGHTFLNNGRLMMAFGDTFGGPARPDFFSTDHQDWRSNTLGTAPAAADPRAGIRFSGMVTDRPNHAKELLRSKKVDGDEMTVIPTNGVSVGNRAYLHYMSVRQWGQPGQWTLNYSGLAYSDDGGATWTKAPIQWSGASNFGQAAFVNQGGYVYMYGIPGGRYGGMKLARVPQGSMLDKNAYQYWSGSGWIPNDEYAATTVIPAPAGEMSVQYNTYYKKWIMMYLLDPSQQIVLRTADSLTGPWSDPQVVADGSRYPQLYGPYILPTHNDGKDIWFTMSTFGDYTVSMMHTSLKPQAPTVPLPAALVPHAVPAVPPARPSEPASHGKGSAPAVG